jgi:hypothetical protein
LAAIRQIVLYVYNALPSPCWGSQEKVEAWLKLRTVAESGEKTVPPMKMAPSTDGLTAEPRKKKSS